MYGFLYLDVLHIHTAIVRRTNICLASFIWMYCICMAYSNCKENKHMLGFLYLDVLHVHTIARITNICMASFIWMYCMFIQQL